MPVFDYALVGDEHNFAVERKALGDFVNSITTSEGQRHEQAKIRKARESFGNLPIIYAVECGIHDLRPARPCACIHPRPHMRCPKCKGKESSCDCVRPRPARDCSWCGGSGLVGYNYERRRIGPPFTYHQVSVMLYSWGAVPLFCSDRTMAACMVEAVLRRRYESLCLSAHTAEAPA